MATDTYRPATVWADWLEKSYNGEILNETRWNGWVCPRFTREVAEQYVADHMALNVLTDDDPRLVWEGDTIVIKHHPSSEWDDEIIEPDADGMYAIGAFSWCWSEDQ